VDAPQTQGVSAMKSGRRSWGLGFYFAISFLGLSTLAAITGPLWLPDPSPLADEICLPLARMSPGTRVEFLRYAPDKLGNGTMLPLTSWKQGKDSMEVTLFNGEASSGTQAVYALRDLVPTAKGGFIHSRRYWLGTDKSGADMLSRLVTGGRISLGVGFCAVLISMCIGITAGLAAGYYGGWADKLLTWLMGVMWSIPSMLLALAVSFALGKGFIPILLAIGLSTWVDVARMVRGQVLSLREREYVLAAKVLGLSDLRIMLRHILPNLKGILLIVATSNFASAILLEAGLSFLGLGIPPPAPSWGGMVRDHYGMIVSGPVYLALLPGLMIMASVMSFHLISARLRV
jgi:peptide/nickel transport system permease protein